MNHVRSISRLKPNGLGLQNYNQTLFQGQSLIAKIQYRIRIRMASSDVDQLQVIHDEKNREFFIKLEGVSEKAVLQYVWEKPGIADLYHTGVPVAFRGRGVAKLLAKAAFDHMVEQESQMVLSCTYLQKYFRENQTDEYVKHTIL